MFKTFCFKHGNPAGVIKARVQKLKYSNAKFYVNSNYLSIAKI